MKYNKEEVGLKEGGGLIYFPSLHSEAYKKEGLTWEGKLNRGFTVVKIMLILHSSCLHQQIIIYFEINHPFLKIVCTHRYTSVILMTFKILPFYSYKLCANFYSLKNVLTKSGRINR